MANSNYEERLTGFLIHGFAVTHAAAAALLLQTLVGDAVVLTGLTVAMIVSIARANNRSWGVGDALSVVSVLAGCYLGTRGAVLLVKWIPGIGNAANAVTTFGVTELLGWIAYLLVKEDKKPGDPSRKQKEKLRKQGI